MKIKQLVWEKVPNVSVLFDMWESIPTKIPLVSQAYLSYSIEKDKVGGEGAFRGEAFDAESCTVFSCKEKTLSEAKAACQAHFEEFVKQFLEE